MVVRGCWWLHAWEFDRSGNWELAAFTTSPVGGGDGASSLVDWRGSVLQ